MTHWGSYPRPTPGSPSLAVTEGRQGKWLQAQQGQQGQRGQRGQWVVAAGVGQSAHIGLWGQGGLISIKAELRCGLRIGERDFVSQICVFLSPHPSVTRDCCL